MSIPKSVSPLLDNILIGDAISEHHGIRCYPAMHKDTGDKYIVKVISLPPSQTQVDALKLAGVVSDDDSIRHYFQERSIETITEIETLQALSRHEGFMPCDGYQLEPSEDGLGFDIYMLSPYRRSLERQFTKRPFTQLDAINLGMDICSALMACRRNGYLFVNLKPNNIYLTPNGEFKISDLGFLNMGNLKYATIPSQYISDYTAPEMKDAFATPNTSIDIYALGAILYSVYNGGVLPSVDADVPPAPQYADEELAAIIVKACSKNPEDRWEDPAQMGQALVNYMQKNGAEDLPIVPPAPVEPEISASDEQEADREIQSIAALVADVEDEPVAEEASVTDAEPESDASIDEEPVCEDTEQLTDAPAEEDPEVDDSIAEISALVTDALSSQDEASVDAADDDVPAEETAEEAAAEDDGEEMDETESEDAPIIESDDENDIDAIIAQADALAALEVPSPVVPAEPSDIAELEAALATEITECSEETPADDVDEIPQDDSAEDSAEDSADDPNEYDEGEEEPRRRSPVLKILLAVLIVLLLAAGAFCFYKFYYMKTVDDIQLEGKQDRLTVFVTSEAEDSLFNVTCTASDGTKTVVPLINGMVEFSGLAPDTEYTITVGVNGFHGINGDITDTYHSPAETEIIDCTVVTGNMLGSAVISFNVEGPDSEHWVLTYKAEGDTQEQTVTFAGHTHTLMGLEKDVVYTGVITPVEDLYLVESAPISFTTTDLIQASDLHISSFEGNALTAQWTAPEEFTVTGWTVICTNDAGFKKSIETAETTATFTDLDTTKAYSVDVIAVGQSMKQSVSIGANAVTVKNIQADSSTTGVLKLSWEATTIPDGGWVVHYTAGDCPTEFTQACSENSVSILPVIPATVYKIVIKAADDSAVACPLYTYTTPDAVNFSAVYGGDAVNNGNLQFSMCKTPAKADWVHSDVKGSDYTTRFSAGQKASFVVFLNKVYGKNYDDFYISYVVKGEDGSIIDISSVKTAWTNMWYKNYCELDMPFMPADAGKYTVSIYFNGQFVTTQSFNIVSY
ncbi:MAG: hypothetical protein IJZ48_03520 [Oscillospiraceae bacterium]|nr:hypothetical protein [Oscillospiraceae bacterium]